MMEQGEKMKRLVGRCSAIATLIFSSVAYPASLIEFVQTDPAKIANYSGVGCDVGAMTGVNEGKTSPIALCAALHVKPDTLTLVTKKTKGLYVCPDNAAVLLTDTDEKFILCGELEAVTLSDHEEELPRRQFRNDSPACPDGEVLTGLSFKNGKLICNSVEN